MVLVVEKVHFSSHKMYLGECEKQQQLRQPKTQIIMNEHWDHAMSFHMTCTLGKILQQILMLCRRPPFPLNVNLQHYQDAHYTPSREMSVVWVIRSIQTTHLYVHQNVTISYFIVYNSYKTLAERVITVELLIVNVATKTPFHTAPSTPQNPSKHKNCSSFIQTTSCSYLPTSPQFNLIFPLLPSPQNTEKLIWWLWIASLRNTAISDAHTSSSRSRKSPRATEGWSVKTLCWIPNTHDRCPEALEFCCVIVGFI